MVDWSKKDQMEYHACRVGKKIACLKKAKKLLIYSRSKSQRRDRAREAKVVGGATFDGIK